MKSILALFFSLAVLAARMPAQSSPSRPVPPNSSAADNEWALLKDLGRGKPIGPNARTEWVADADRLKDFYTKHPDHAEAKNAKCLEGLALVRAWLAGDVAQAARRERVVSEVRRDKAVAVSLRAELFAFADHVEIGKRKGLTRDARLLAYEQAVRALIAEFPALPNGYESLVRIAGDSVGPKAIALAGEIVQMPAAPAHVKAEARVVLARFSLVGQSLPELARPILGPNHSLAKLGDQSIFVYAWATASPMSIMRAKTLGAKAPPGAVLMGVCLDERELGAAQARAAVERLPGEQIYDGSGRRGALARRLELTEPGLIYATDVTGVIRSVAVQNDLNSPLLAPAR